jgi:hypothetical protein
MQRLDFLTNRSSEKCISAGALASGILNTGRSHGEGIFPMHIYLDPSCIFCGSRRLN